MKISSRKSVVNFPLDKRKHCNIAITVAIPDENYGKRVCEDFYAQENA